MIQEQQQRLLAAAERDGLTDDDHVACVGGDGFVTVAELRAAACQAPRPYDVGIAALRAASATPEGFEDDYKRQGTAAFNRTRAALDAEEAPAPARLTAAELSIYAPPDIFAEGIRKLREKESPRMS
ncbi:MAG: hypothetical protein WBC33_01260 [Conexibacter sp.]